MIKASLLWSSITFKTLNFLPFISVSLIKSIDHNREALINEAYYSIPAKRLVESLKKLIIFRSKPKRIRTDNGPEFISKIFVNFCQEQGIELQYIQPGKPAQNAYIERLNRTFREDIIDAYLFQNIQEVNTLAFDCRWIIIKITRINHSMV